MTATHWQAGIQAASGTATGIVVPSRLGCRLGLRQLELEVADSAESDSESESESDSLPVRLRASGCH